MVDELRMLEEEARSHAHDLSIALSKIETLPDVLRYRGDKTAGQDFRFLHLESHDRDHAGPAFDEEADAAVYSYAELLALAERVADVLQTRGVGANDKVLIVLPTGPAFIGTFLACQLLGAIPVPAVPPYSFYRLDEYLGRTAALAKTAHAVAVVTAQRLVPLFRASGKRKSSAFGNLVSDEELLRHGTRLSYAHEVGPDATAMIQFTSGSTGTQKGVVLSHRNLLANTRAIGLASRFVPSDVCVTWLPLYHDMGLIGHFLGALVWGMPMVMLPPLHFVKRPSSWFNAISKYKGSCSAGPNFAYSLCVKKIRAQTLEKQSVDLSSWRVAYCGAEPIDPRTVEAFIEKFEPHGFSRGSFFPVYGMAENALAVSFPPPGRGPRYETLDRKHFEQTGEVKSPEGEAEALKCVSLGVALPEHELRIVDEVGEVLGEGCMGEIELRGPSRMVGYYENEEATAAVLREGGWLRSGDFGFMKAGEVYITGRKKEMIIKSGRNYFPQDIEAAAGRVKGIRTGCSAAFGLWNSARGTEDLVVVCETKLKAQAQDALHPLIRQACVEDLGTSPDKIILVETGSVPKTSSGKIQRRLTQERYLNGDLTPGSRPALTLATAAVFHVVESARSAARRLLKPR